MIRLLHQRFSCIREALERLFIKVKHVGIFPKVAAGFIGVMIAVGVQHRLARPDICAFDPAQMGSLESSMWRSYYEGRWGRLGWQTLRVSCGQYRFSWWDGVRIAWHAAISAKYFRKNTGDPRCLEELEAYYRIVQQGIERPLDTRELAQLELQWWKERRLNIPQQDYARTVARLTGLLYGVGENKALPAADLRTRAMVYRDARRNGKMKEADWVEVERQLTQAYASLKNELGPHR